MMVSVLFFFFQAEDGIRDVAVTGVQTCALPISSGLWLSAFAGGAKRGGFELRGRVPACPAGFQSAAAPPPRLKCVRAEWCAGRPMDSACPEKRRCQPAGEEQKGP